MNLDELARKYGTDKSTKAHGYTLLYERYFDEFDSPHGSLLELGWGGHEDPALGGASARMWRDWFPGWQIVVVDNEEKLTTDADGITLLRADQADPGIGVWGPFDVIIDDASHLSSKTIESFDVLWPSLVPGGWYVVEDTHMAYHDFYYGHDEAHEDPDGQLPNGRRTAMQFLRRLADEANYREDGDLFDKQYWLGFEVEEVHFHHNICFVRKRL